MARIFFVIFVFKFVTIREVQKMFKKKGGNKGFTLIELLVVIAIIGILASIVLASLNTARRKSRDARRIADIKQIQLALELYFDAASEYPTAASNALMSPTYMPSVPTDPTGAIAYRYHGLISNAGTDCVATDTCLFYHLGANLEESGNTALNGDRDGCAATGAGCVTPTISGTSVTGEDTSRCESTATDRFCYDVTP